MREYSTLFRYGATCLVAWLLVVGTQLRAQSIAEIPRKHSPALEQLNQAELIESHRLLREQLRAAEQAILNNRLEAETTASARTTAIMEKIEALQRTMAIERERLQQEARRMDFEREQQQIAAQAMTQNIFQFVLLIGGAGLVALCAIALLQWRGNKRLAEYTTQLQLQSAPDRLGWTPAVNGTPGDEKVVLANQRLVSTLDRMERRVVELEQTLAPPAPVASVTLDNRRKVASNPPNDPAQAAQIAALLERGQSLLNAKKAAEALACYDEILRREANHAEALLKKGSALERLQQKDEALRYYDRAIAADPDLALAYIAKGGLCVRLERFEEAYNCYEEALRAGRTRNPGESASASVLAG